MGVGLRECVVNQFSDAHLLFVTFLYVWVSKHSLGMSVTRWLNASLPAVYVLLSLRIPLSIISDWDLVAVLAYKGVEKGSGNCRGYATQ